MDKESLVLERYLDSRAGLTKKEGSDEENDSNVDELLAEVEEDDAIQTRYRENRMQELNNHFREIDSSVKEKGRDSGNILFLEDEKLVMDKVAKSQAAVVHFYQPEFRRCLIMNAKLEQIAKKYLEIDIIVVKAEKAPFLVAKLGIKVLPFLVCYRNGREMTRMTGFEKIDNNSEDLDLASFEKFLFTSGVVRRHVSTSNFQGRKSKNSEVSDDDLDI